MILMKIVELKDRYVHAHYIEQLNKLNYLDTEGKTPTQLRSILTKLRAIEQFKQINHDSSENVWFE